MTEMTPEEKKEFLGLLIASIVKNIEEMSRWSRPSLCVGCPELDVGNISFLLLEQERYLRLNRYLK